MKMFGIDGCYDQQPDLTPLYAPVVQKNMNINLEENDNCLIPLFMNGHYDENKMMDVSMTEFTNRANYESTAAHKQLIFKVEADAEPDNWKNKEPKNWTKTDVMHWYAHIAEAESFPYEQINPHMFNLDGSVLCKLSLTDFRHRDNNYGELLYSSLQKSQYLRLTSPYQLSVDCIKKEKMDTRFVTLTKPNHDHFSFTSYPIQNEIASSSESYPFALDTPDTKTEPPDPQIDTPSTSDSDSDFELKDQKPNKKSVPGKRPPGRPPGVKTKKNKPEKKTGRLWEFIRDLLLDPDYCPSVICWENHDDGVFRFVKSEKVAKIWGGRKGNEKMTYEKLSRAMRYYYKSKVLQPVLGRRLVYKFGPTARGWQTNNPNFKNMEA